MQRFDDLLDLLPFEVMKNVLLFKQAIDLPMPSSILMQKGEDEPHLSTRLRIDQWLKEPDDTLLQLFSQFSPIEANLFIQTHFTPGSPNYLEVEKNKTKNAYFQIWHALITLDVKTLDWDALTAEKVGAIDQLTQIQSRQSTSLTLSGLKQIKRSLMRMKVILENKGYEVPEGDRREDPCYVNLNSANLAGRHFWRGDWWSSANLEYWNLSGANLQLLDAHGVSGVQNGCNFSHTNLSGANLRGADLRDCHCHEAILIGANLSGANLSLGSNFSYADFTRANLKGADLCKSLFSCTNFTEADLTAAILTDASMDKAIFYRAIVFGAIFSGVHFKKIDFSNTQFYLDVIFKNEIDFRVYLTQHHLVYLDSEDNITQFRNGILLNIIRYARTESEKGNTVAALKVLQIAHDHPLFSKLITCISAPGNVATRTINEVANGAFSLVSTSFNFFALRLSQSTGASLQLMETKTESQKQLEAVMEEITQMSQKALDTSEQKEKSSPTL